MIPWEEWLAILASAEWSRQFNAAWRQILAARPKVPSAANNRAPGQETALTATLW